MAGFTRSRWPVVGRDGEIDDALGLLNAGSRGLIIHGEAGVGKTTLANTLLKQLSAGPDSPHLVRLRTDAAVLSTPWTVFADVLDPVGGDSASLTHALGQLLRRFSGAGPVMLHLEDAHLLDVPSATALSELIQSTNVTVLATTRSEPGPPAPLVALWRAGFLNRLDLHPLDPAIVSDLVSQFLGGAVTQECSRRMWRTTGGNPLYLRELVLALLESQALGVVDGAWSWDGTGPPGKRIVDLVRHELTGLEAPVREVVDLVALGGTMPVERLAEAVTDEALRTVLDSGLLVLDQDDRTGRGLVRITHPIHAEAIRSLILPGQRRALFHRLSVPPEGTSDLNELFHRVNWALQCGIEPEPDQLLAATRAAAEVESAALTIRMADEALRRFDDPAIAAEILILRAEAHRFDGKTDDALGDLRAARNNLEHLGATPESKSLWVRLAELTADIQQYHQDDLEQALTTLDRASRRLPARCRSLRRRLRIGRLTRLGFAGKFAMCVPEIEQMRGDQSSDHPAGVQLVPVLALGYAQQGRLHDALRVCTEALTGWREEFNAFPWVHGEIRSAWFMTCLWLGDIQAAIEPPGARHATARYDEAVSQTGSGRYRAALGQWNQAIREYRGALSRFAARDPSGMAPLAWIGLAQACAAVGADDDARAARDQYLSLATRTTRAVETDCRHSLVQVAIALGEADAHDQACRLVDWSADQGLWLGALRAAHLALCSARSADQEVLLRDLQRLASRVDGPVPTALVEHGRALVNGDPEVLSYRVKELAELGVWVPVASQRVHLTPRQWEIANLVTHGLSNRQIAERLVLSVRTVDTHVGHIFARLSVRSRADLTRALTRAR